MPFSCQLKLPSYKGFPIEAKLVSWKQECGMIEKGDTLANITIGGIPHVLCISFPCYFSSRVANAGDVIKTGDIVPACGADGENIPGGRDYLFIRAV